MELIRRVLAGFLFALPAAAQTSADLKQILERLERLEQENRALAAEVHALRQEIAGTTAEQTAIHEARIEELAQTKVEASQRYPIRLTGMALFNTFLNSKQSGGGDYPPLAALTRGGSGGATVRQSIIGLDYRGPQTFWGGGAVHGSVSMDFFGGTGALLNQDLRVRTAEIRIDWKTRSVAAALDKPIFNPREPSSLAQVGVSPLTGAGNLWLWIPQIKFEQRAGGFTAQVGAVQTRESASYQASNYVADFEARRPGIEGRFEFAHGGENARLEVAPGFHVSTSHVSETSVPSRLISLDWLLRPMRAIEVTGAAFAGENVAHLGTGGIRQGYAVLGERVVRNIHTQGGWSQLTWTATQRLSFHFFAGVHDDRDSDLNQPGRISSNQAFGANFFYRLAPNVIVSIETSQFRTKYLGIGNRLNNHYDLALAYLF